MSEGSRIWSVLDLLRWTTDYFASKGIDGARLDAECLLAHALGTERLRLYLDHDKPVLEDERARYRDLVKRRAEDRVPVALLTGTKEFWSLPLRVTPDVLVPRPDTETLVEAVLGRLPERDAPLRLLDLGTGSGAVALALARELANARVVATDVSARALDVARDNAARLGLAERVRFVAGDGLAPVAGSASTRSSRTRPTWRAPRRRRWRPSSPTSPRRRSSPVPRARRCCGASRAGHRTSWRPAACWRWSWRPPRWRTSPRGSGRRASGTCGSIAISVSGRVC